MATQTCPKCNADSLVWSIDDGDILTQWGCECGYVAFEDESLEKICLECSNKSKSKLEDAKSTYWWCFICKTVEKI
ncbi:MAG: hypothetical protein ACI8Q1_001393 [Parvicella sp.]|jgi:hypothetical protein